jgi:EAL domain-containing protein (putative c-di-GMP-specific phosphodiesterase class I)/GGDEF domain-containing protein
MRPAKILVVERREARSALRERLLCNLDLQVAWQRVDNEPELRDAARRFAPDVVLGCDQAPQSDDVDLQLLLLSRVAPEVRICELCDERAVPWSSSPPQVGESLRRRLVSSAGPEEPRARLRTIPRCFRQGGDATVVIDGEGWIRHANRAAESLLDARGFAQMHHAQDLLGALNLNGTGSGAVPIVSLNLEGLPLLDEAYGVGIGDAILALLSEAVQPRFARCGMLARVGPDESLLVLPRPSAVADAAVAVLDAKDGASRYAITPWSGERQAANNDIPLLVEPLPPTAARKPPRHAPARPRVDESELSRALASSALTVVYQPQFELCNGRGSGVEALARWTLPGGQRLSPSVFIPVAEKSGLIRALDTSVLRSACRAAAGWQGSPSTLAVNVSAQQVVAEYARILSAILAGTGLPPPRLEIEIEESILTADLAKSRAVLRAWKTLGVRVAVKHSLLAAPRLHEWALPVDRLKLDKALIHQLPRDREVAARLRQVIAAAREQGMAVVAEGVESEQQLVIARTLGCSHAQGYLLARPQSAPEAQRCLGRTWGNLPRAPREALIPTVH